MPYQPAFSPKYNTALLITNLTILALILINSRADYECFVLDVSKDFVSGTLFGLSLWGAVLGFYNMLAPFCSAGQKQEGVVRLGHEKS